MIVNSKWACRSDVMVIIPAVQPGGPGSIIDGVRQFNLYPGIWYVSFVFCPVLSLAVALTFCSPHIHALVLLSSVLVHICGFPYRHMTIGNLDCKFRWVVVLYWGRVNRP